MNDKLKALQHATFRALEDLSVMDAVLDMVTPTPSPPPSPPSVSPPPGDIRADSGASPCEDVPSEVLTQLVDVVGPALLEQLSGLESSEGWWNGAVQCPVVQPVAVKLCAPNNSGGNTTHSVALCT